mgnify:FL=1
MTTFATPWESRKVRMIEIRIGDEWAKHNFGRDVPLDHARQWALHFVDAMTGFHGEHDMPTLDVREEG